MRVTPEDVLAEWLAAAELDLQVAERITDAPTAAAFHLQEAAEKALKAFILRQKIKPPRTHDISQLRNLAGPSLAWTTDPTILARLTMRNAAFRYPDMNPVDAPTEAQVVETIEQVRSLLDEFRQS